MKSIRLCFLHECRGLVSSSEYRPWVGCVTLSLRSYRNSLKETEREREMADSLSRTQWPDSGSLSHLLAFLSAVLLIIGENLWGHSFNWILNDIGSGWGSFMQTPGSCGLEKTVNQINQQEGAREGKNLSSFPVKISKHL